MNFANFYSNYLSLFPQNHHDSSQNIAVDASLKGKALLFFYYKSNDFFEYAMKFENIIKEMKGKLIKIILSLFFLGESFQTKMDFELQKNEFLLQNLIKDNDACKLRATEIFDDISSIKYL